jgi:hypothetical protein
MQNPDISASYQINGAHIPLFVCLEPNRKSLPCSAKENVK